jgi:3-deoxy-D-manno-octulosonic-acid transferase
MLNAVYKGSQGAFVGGGFGAGVHSLTEPAAVGMPLACGPAIHKQPDAQQFVQEGFCRVIASPTELEQWVTAAVVDRQTNALLTRRSSQYVANQSGGTEMYIQHLLPILKATNGGIAP